MIKFWRPGFTLPIYITICALVLPVFHVYGLHPIILVPGDGGNQMEAKLNKSEVVHFFCTKTTKDYYTLWLDLAELLVPLKVDCWVDNVRLVYNATSRTTSNSPGVDIRVPGFGNTTVVEYLDPSKISPGYYFYNIVENSLLPLGYERNVNIKGAPYDFRKAPNEMHEWMENFKTLVEETYTMNGNSSVIFLCHSMGSPISLYFLQRMPASWKEKHIRALITLAGVWGGTVKALKDFAAGDNLGWKVLPSKKLREEQRTAPSTAWLLPHKTFWKSDEILATIPGKGNYTVNDYKRFFTDMNHVVGYEMRKDTENLLGNLEPPGVEVYCLYGTGISSVESLVFKNANDFPDNPTFINGNGDGTVNVRSLRGCLRWDKNRKSRSSKSKMMKKRLPKERDGDSAPKIFNQEFPGVEHNGILSNSGVMAYIKQIVQKLNK